MNETGVNYLKEIKEEQEIIIKRFNEVGIDKEELKKIYSAFDLKNDLYYKDSSDNDYSSGLSKGCKDQAQYTVRVVLEKLYPVIFEKDDFGVRLYDDLKTYSLNIEIENLLTDEEANVYFIKNYISTADVVNDKIIVLGTLKDFDVFRVDDTLDYKVTEVKDANIIEKVKAKLSE